VECKYQRFGNKDGEELDWMEKFIADEKDRDGDDTWKVDPHFEVPRHGFFQTLAYMQLFNCDAGLIVYPTTASAGEALVGLSGADSTSRKRFGYVPIGPDENQQTKACNAALEYAILDCPTRKHAPQPHADERGRSSLPKTGHSPR